MFVSLSSTSQVLKTSLLNNIFLLTNFSMDAMSSICLFLLGSMGVHGLRTIAASMYKVSLVTEQSRYVLGTYRNSMFCTYVLRNISFFFVIMQETQFLKFRR